MSQRNQIHFNSLSDVPDRVVSQGSMLWNRTGSWRYLRPAYQTLTPPCNNGCPAGTNVEGFIKLAGEKEFDRALRLIREENPLSSVCGRVCFHPCEQVCNRYQYDHSIAINAIERFVSDRAAKGYTPEKLFGDTGRRVAIVGSGPAGLSCAYHLARFGHSVTVFEKSDRPGGILRYGIPTYRLPKDILDMEIEAIQSLGVEIKCNTALGKELSFKDLDAFDAVFLGIGCHRERTLFESDAKGFFPSLKFLTLAAKAKVTSCGAETAIIGGGNSAVDAARTALRLGARVTVYYHRNLEDMPAFEEEIRDAMKEGVEFEFLAQPVDLVFKWGKLKGLKLRKTKPGKPDADGRRRPVPVPGSEYTVKADTVIAAIGEMTDLDLVPEGVARNGWRLDTDQFCRTSMDKVFAGGDAALDDHNIAEAIGSGKTAACAMDAYLSGRDILDLANRITVGSAGRVSASLYAAAREGIDPYNGDPARKKDVVPFEDINTAYFYKKQRSKKEKLAPADRTKGFDEVVKSLSANAVLMETERCFHCGVCNACDNCLKFCPDVSVMKRSGGYDIDLDYCKGCGICVNECPRSAMAMEEDI